MVAVAVGTVLPCDSVVPEKWPGMPDACVSTENLPTVAGARASVVCQVSGRSKSEHLLF